MEDGSTASHNPDAQDTPAIPAAGLAQERGIAIAADVPAPDLGRVYFTDVFDVDPDVLDEYGAFDISLINDLPLFIDPFLLFNSEKAEYRALHDAIIRYLRFLRDKALADAVTPGLLEAWFTFREVKQNWLGFSRVGNGGSGLGRDFAEALDRNLRTVFQSFGEETVTSGAHLEKLCLIKDGVGRDNISDFTTTLIKEFLLEYTQTFAREHVDPSKRRSFVVEKVGFNYGTESWQRGTYELPAFGRDFVLLTPKDLLTKDEIWINRAELLDNLDEIGQALPDPVLRDQVNNYLYQQLSMEEPTQEEISAARQATIEMFPILIEHYIRLKEEHGDDAESVSHQRVREAERQFIEEVKALRRLLATRSEFYDTKGTTLDEARSRVMFLKDVIENKDGYRFFYLRGKLIEREDHLQILYRLTWFQSASDVNREVNNGRGPVDFAVSRGARDKSLVEFKLASNKQLKRNLQHQVEIYQSASDAPHALKVITYFTEAQRNRVVRILRELNIDTSPDIILIDARNDNKPSASTAA